MRVPEEWPSSVARYGQNPAYRPSGYFCSWPSHNQKEQNRNITFENFLLMLGTLRGIAGDSAQYSLTAHIIPCYPMLTHKKL